MRGFIIKVLITASLTGAWTGLVLSEFQTGVKHAKASVVKQPERAVAPPPPAVRPGFGAEPRSLTPGEGDVGSK
jgi:hypothetical protein